MEISTSRARLIAVLGPTNTGKTHFAMERMLAHSSGMIGFPLRLLARENYDRVIEIKGRGRVALITGEEKIIPSGARYFLCTVESMPVDRSVAFLAIDEVQMCADPDRGHVFTDRLLHARGREETMFMGADTMAPVIRRLVPGVEFTTRPRLSSLTHVGHKRITRLPKRSAIVAFSGTDVYAIAELVRRQRGGAAVVMGALSPRTRNAQVNLYQDGGVDYMVATDAIGMGLNMDVGHVAFASRAKFDGRASRNLRAPELAQIAGRAGRHMNDGTFGTTGDAKALEDEMAARIEGHEFDALRHIYWRNGDLDFRTLDALRRSLGAAPDIKGLKRVRQAEDEQALAHLASDPEVSALAGGPAAIRLLWRICQIPDFRKLMSDGHARLLGAVFKHLMAPAERLPTDWLAAQVSRLERTDGDIDTLTQRIAAIRTWTYISFHGEWLKDAGHWQDRTRTIEDKLSDALHERLTQRFVDQRTAALMSRMKDTDDLLAAVKADGEVIVEGHPVGHLKGLRFEPHTPAYGADETAASKAVMRAATRALRGEIAERVKRFENEADTAFDFELNGTGPGPRILWRGEPVARVTRGTEMLSPEARVETSDLLETVLRQRLERRLVKWLQEKISQGLAPLATLRGTDVTGPARGIVFQVVEGLGSIPRRQAADEVSALSRADRQSLRRLGLRIGRESIYIPALLKPGAINLRSLLWSIWWDSEVVTAPPPPGRVSIPSEDIHRPAWLEAIGYRVFGPLALRIDILERLAARAWTLSREGPFAPPAELMNLAGCGVEDLANILNELGYRRQGQGDALRLRSSPPKSKRKRAGRRNAANAVLPDENSPFAKLKDLRLPSAPRPRAADGQGRIPDG